MMIPWWEHSEKGVTGTDRQTDRRTDRKTERKTVFFLRKIHLKMLSAKCWSFFSGLNIGLFHTYFHQGVSSTKVKKRNSAYFQISNKILYQSKKNTWYILKFIEALARSQMKVKAVLNKFYNFISNPCTMYVPIKYPAICTICIIYYTKYHTIQYRNNVMNRKKIFNKIF